LLRKGSYMYNVHVYGVHVYIRFQTVKTGKKAKKTVDN